MGRRRFDPAAYRKKHPNIKAELRTAVSALPIKRGQSVHIDLVVDALINATVLHRVKELPQVAVNKAAVRRSLKRFTALAGNLVKCIDDMPDAALREINSSRYDGRERLAAVLARQPAPTVIVSLQAE